MNSVFMLSQKTGKYADVFKYEFREERTERLWGGGGQLIEVRPNNGSRYKI